jgi:hypothetical protein
MKYKAKRKVVQAHRSIADGNWKKAERQITAAFKMNKSADLSYRELRALAKIRMGFKSFMNKEIKWPFNFFKSNVKDSHAK